MNAPVTIPKTECPIITLLPGCHGDEYVMRRRLLSVKNIMAAKIHELPPGHAMQVAWLTIEICTEWIFAPADLEKITEAAELARRLLIIGTTIEKLEGRP